MKKIVSLLLLFVCISAFAQEKIGTISKQNVLFVSAVNNKPAYVYFEYNNDGNRLFYINYNNKNYGPYNYVYLTYSNFANPEFTGSHLSLLVELPDRQFAVFSDGNIYGPYAVVYTWKHISDKEYLYAANEEYTEDDDSSFETKLYCNGKELPNTRDIIVSNKKNKAKVVAQISSKKQFYVEYKNNKYGPYDNEIVSIDFLADGETLVFKAEKNDKDYIVVNGKENGPYEECSFITFSENKKHYAYKYKKNNQDVLVKDGKIFGTYSNLEFYKFNEETGELCVIDYNSKQDSMDLHYDGSTYKDVSYENIFFYKEKLKAGKNSIMYYTDGDSRRTKNAYINEKKLHENIISIFPSFFDIYDYAYLTSKPIPNNSSSAYADDPFDIPGSTDYVDDYGYYGSKDYDDENIFNADCLVYNNKEYLLKGPVSFACPFNKKDIFYATRNMNQSISFYLNENEIYKSEPYVMGENLETIKIGKDYVFFTLTYENVWEQKVYYNGKIYPGSVIENQLVYVDNGNVYLKKYKPQSQDATTIYAPGKNFRFFGRK